MAGERARQARALSRAQAPSKLRRRAGVVVSVQTGYTCTIRLAGDTTNISGVRYMGAVAPEPDSIVWLDTDGYDLVVVGAVAGVGAALPAAHFTLNPANQAITNAIGTIPGNAVQLNAVNDAWGLLRSGAGDTRIYAPVDGWYITTAWLTYAANATGLREASVQVNRATYIGRQIVTNVGGGQAHLIHVTGGPFVLARDDYVEVGAGQTSGANLNLTACRISFAYLGPAA